MNTDFLPSIDISGWPWRLSTFDLPSRAPEWIACAPAARQYAESQSLNSWYHMHASLLHTLDAYAARSPRQPKSCILSVPPPLLIAFVVLFCCSIRSLIALDSSIPSYQTSFALRLTRFVDLHSLCPLVPVVTQQIVPLPYIWIYMTVTLSPSLLRHSSYPSTPHLHDPAGSV